MTEDIVDIEALVQRVETAEAHAMRLEIELASLRDSSIVRAALQSGRENADTLSQLRRRMWAALGMSRYNGSQGDDAVVLAVQHQRDDLRMMRNWHTALTERMDGMIEAVTQSWALLGAVEGTQPEGWATKADTWARLHSPDYLQWTIEPGLRLTPTSIVCKHLKYSTWTSDVRLCAPGVEDTWLHHVIVLDWKDSRPLPIALVCEESFDQVIDTAELTALLLNYGHGRPVLGLVRVRYNAPITAEDIVTAGDMLIREVRNA